MEIRVLGNVVAILISENAEQALPHCSQDQELVLVTSIDDIQQGQVSEIEVQNLLNRLPPL